jgi:methyltransferase
MARWFFLAFAVLVAGQRYLEMRRNDRRLATRSPHWTATALIAIHTAVLAAAVVELFLRRPPFQPILLAIGLILFLAGFALRRWVIHTMAELWSIDVERLEGHRLITDGPFSWCRHPNYLAIVLEIGGYCLIGHALWTLTIGLPLYGLLLAARIVAEERVLIATFGERYVRYRRTRTALLPIGALRHAGKRASDG